MMISKIKRFFRLLRLEIEFFIILIIGLVYIFIDKIKNLPTIPSDNILFIQIYGIGNFILSSTMQWAIKEHFQNEEIFALVHPAIKELAEKSPSIDKIIVYEDRTISGKIKLINRLRRTNFALAVDLSGTYWTAWLTRLSRAPKRIGFNAVGVKRLWFNLDGSGKLYTCGILFNHNIHMKEFYDKFLDVLDVPLKDKDLKIFIPKEDIEFAEQVLKGQSPIITIHIGARQKERLWETGKFVELINQLLAKKNVRIILLGAVEDIERGNKILSSINKSYTGAVVSFIGKMTLCQLSAIVARCDLFIGHDSGPMHIACAVKTNVVALFGPGVVELWGPWSKKSVVVRSQVPCRGCNRIGHFYNCSKNVCMSEISVTQVLNAVEKLLNY